MDVSAVTSDHVWDTVLCLDGGGIRGLIILEILEAIEKEAGKPIIDLFDWIGGTSTGGIIALGIATGKRVSEIRTTYNNLKDQVFTGSAPYDSERMETLMKEEFGKTQVMTDIKKAKVLVTSVLGDHHPWKLHMFRSYKEDKETEEDLPFELTKPPNETYIWEVARSTSASPTYFNPYKQFYDGGIMSNNPTMDMLEQIQEYYSRPNIPGSRSLGVVVSIGCGYVEYAKQEIPDPHCPKMWDYLNPFKLYKVLSDTRRFFNALLEQVTISHGQPPHRTRAWCHMLKVPFYRFSPLLAENVPMNCVDERVLKKMLQDTKYYIKTPEHFNRIERVASDLKAGQYVKPVFWEDGVQMRLPTNLTN